MSKFKKRMIVALSLLFLTIGCTYFTQNTSKKVFSITKKVPIYRVDTQKKDIAITFDVSLGNNDYTQKILDVLDKQNVKATFFILGEWVDKYPDKVKEIHKRGHEIANHSNTHPDMSRTSKEKIINDVNINDAKLRKITGEGTKLFRFPSGSYNDLAVDILREMGYYSIQWDVDSIDWKENGADLEYERVIKKSKQGSIILFHNTAKYTPQNLERIIKKLKMENFNFVKVGDLIYKGNYSIDSAGIQKKN